MTLDEHWGKPGAIVRFTVMKFRLLQISGDEYICIAQAMPRIRLTF